MARLAVLWLALAGTLLAQSEPRHLKIDGGRVEGIVRFHTQLNWGRDRMGNGGKLWDQLREQHADRIVIPLALDASDTKRAKATEQPWPIFPDASRNPQDPASYHFGAVDDVVRKARESTTMVTARLHLGSLASQPTARMSEMVSRTVMHFNAEGSDQPLTEWELCGNADSAEPDLLTFVSRALKAYIPTLSLGRCMDSVGSADLASELKDAGAFDFLAWRLPPVGDNPSDAFRMVTALRSKLDGAGLRKAALRLMNTELEANDEAKKKDGLSKAAFLAAELIYLQDTAIESVPVDLWRSATSAHAEKQRAVLNGAAEMRKTPSRLVVEGGDIVGYAVLAGRSDDRRRIQVLIANYQGKSHDAAKSAGESPDGYDLEVTNLPWGEADFGVYRYRVDEKRNLDLISSGGGRGGSLHLESKLPANAVELVVLQQEARPVTDRLSRRRSRAQQ